MVVSGYAMMNNEHLDQFQKPSIDQFVEQDRYLSQSLSIIDLPQDIYRRLIVEFFEGGKIQSFNLQGKKVKNQRESGVYPESAFHASLECLHVLCSHNGFGKCHSLTMAKTQTPSIILHKFSSKCSFLHRDSVTGYKVTEHNVRKLLITTTSLTKYVDRYLNTNEIPSKTNLLHRSGIEYATWMPIMPTYILNLLKQKKVFVMERRILIEHLNLKQFLLFLRDEWTFDSMYFNPYSVHTKRVFGVPENINTPYNIEKENRLKEKENRLKMTQKRNRIRLKLLKSHHKKLEAKLEECYKQLEQQIAAESILIGNLCQERENTPKRSWLKIK